MQNRKKFEEIPKITVCSSLTVTNSYSQTTTTVTSAGGFSRSEYRATVSGNNPSSYLSPTMGVRTAFNGQPGAYYRSLNMKKLEPINDKPPEKKKSQSLVSFLFKSNDKEKEVKNVEIKNKETKKKKETKPEKTKKETPVVSVDARQTLLSPYTFKPNYTTLEDMRDMNKRLVIKVKKTGKFLGTEADKIPTYLTNSKYSRGKVLLINNIQFTNREKFRAGAEVDQENITKLFKEMGFTINAHKNKTRKEMEKIITNYCSDSSLKRADINVTIIMSHGNGDYSNTYIETVDNGCVQIKWIVEQFSNSKCKYLENKPKIFIFQCCRGPANDIQVDSSPFQTPTASRTAADMLLAFATVPGYVSHRDTKLGTWYIQSICKIFMEHAHDTDVENLLKIVDENLEKMNLTRRQTSSYENRGFKRCFLNPI